MRASSRARGLILVGVLMAAGWSPSADAGWMLNRSFGGTGTGRGLFNGAANVAVGASDQFVVVDQGNGKIQLFGQSGYFRREFGSLGTGTGQFRDPVGVAFTPEGNIAVLDRRSSRVQIYNPMGRFLRQFSVTGNVVDLSISSEGTYAVVERLNRVTLYDANGNFLRQIEPPPPAVRFRPDLPLMTYDVAFVDADTLAIAIGPEDRRGVHFFNTQGQFLYGIDGPIDLNGDNRNNDPGEWDFPWSISVNGKGQFAVSNSYELPVSLFDMQGNYIDWIGDRPLPYHSRVFWTIAFNSKGHLIRVDRDNNLVNIYRPTAGGSRVSGAGAQAVPEPSSLALLGLGVVSLFGGSAVRRWKRRRGAAAIAR